MAQEVLHPCAGCGEEGVRCGNGVACLVVLRRQGQVEVTGRGPVAVLEVVLRREVEVRVRSLPGRAAMKMRAVGRRMAPVLHPLALCER